MPYYFVGCVFLDRAGRFSCFWIAYERATRRILRRFCDTGKLQRLAVRPPGVAIKSFEVYRPVGNDFVEIFFVRQASGREKSVVPSASQNPEQFGMSGRVVFNPLPNFGYRGGIVEIHLQDAQRSVQEVNVAVGETRQNKTPLRIDDAGPFSAMSF